MSDVFLMGTCWKMKYSSKQADTQTVSQEANKQFAKLHFLLILPADQMVTTKTFALDLLFSEPGSK